MKAGLPPFARLLLITAFASGCATTPLGSIPVRDLTDEQLIEELESAATQIGVEFNRTQYLLATRPDPAYVLTSSQTQSFGRVQGSINAFVLPTSYGARVQGQAWGAYSGVSTTQYFYTDANSFARSANSLALAIAGWRADWTRERAKAVQVEIQRRIELRDREMRALIGGFFDDNPDLRERANMLSFVAPWVAATATAMEPREMLERAATVVRGTPRSGELPGTWYGLFSQTTTSDNGEVVTFSDFVRLSMRSDGAGYLGRGELGSGERIEIRLVADQLGRVAGSVANTSSIINVAVTGIFAANQITIEYEGGGLAERAVGTAVLVR